MGKVKTKQEKLKKKEELKQQKQQALLELQGAKEEVKMMITKKYLDDYMNIIAGCSKLSDELQDITVTIVEEHILKHVSTEDIVDCINEDESMTTEEKEEIIQQLKDEEEAAKDIESNYIKVDFKKEANRFAQGVEKSVDVLNNDKSILADQLNESVKDTSKLKDIIK